MNHIRIMALTAISLFAAALGANAQDYTSTYDFILKDSAATATQQDTLKAKKKKKDLNDDEGYKAWLAETKRKEAEEKALKRALREEARQNREWQRVVRREQAAEQASERGLRGFVEVDFVSQYLWRGSEMAGISIQPRAGLEWQGLSLELSGSSALERDDTKEIDATLQYTIGGFNIGVTDYWTSGQDYQKRDQYFYFDPQATAHQLEGNIGFSCRYFSLQGYTMLWGNDFKYDNLLDADFRVNGKRAWSTYIELSIPFFLGGLDWNLTGGMTPFESAGELVQTDEGLAKTYFYADGPACVSASLRATKNFVLGDIKMPLFAEIHTNPYMQKAYFIVGLSFKPFK